MCLFGWFATGFALCGAACCPGNYTKRARRDEKKDGNERRQLADDVTVALGTRRHAPRSPAEHLPRRTHRADQPTPRDLAMRLALLLLCVLAAAPCYAGEPTPPADEILRSLKDFYRKTARPDGSFQPGIDPDYRGMSDSAYSDLTAVTYAVTIHK